MDGASTALPAVPAAWARRGAGGIRSRLAVGCSMTARSVAWMAASIASWSASSVARCCSGRLLHGNVEPGPVAGHGFPPLSLRPTLGRLEPAQGRGLLDALGHVTDPRGRRGRRHPLPAPPARSRSPRCWPAPDHWPRSGNGPRTPPSPSWPRSACAVIRSAAPIDRPTRRPSAGSWPASTPTPCCRAGPPTGRHGPSHAGGPGPPRGRGRTRAASSTSPVTQRVTGLVPATGRRPLPAWR